jgi:hypothetical protein
MSRNSPPMTKLVVVPAFNRSGIVTDDVAWVALGQRSLPAAHCGRGALRVNEHRPAYVLDIGTRYAPGLDRQGDSGAAPT